MSKLRDDFLWGGAVTAHQTEGAYDQDGKVPAVCDLLATPANQHSKRELTAITALTKILRCLKSWTYNVIAFQWTGRGLPRMERPSMKRAWNFTTVFWIR